jgi:hypothetical protein
MKTILQTLKDEQELNATLLIRARRRLMETNQAIANGEIPEVAPSRVFATIEYLRGNNTGLATAIRAIELLGEDI